MKFKVLMAVTFVVVLISSLVVHVPVNWLWQQVSPVAGVKLTGLSGTPWRGSAAQVNWQNQNLGRLQWQIKLMPLLSGKVEYSVRFGEGSTLRFNGRGVVGYAMSGPYAENLLVSAPAQALLNYAAVPVPATVTGNLELTLRQYQYAAPWCQSLDGSLAWTAATVNSPLGELEPGAVIAELACEQGQLNATAEQASKDVSSQWQASLSINRSYNLAGWFKPGAEFPESLGKQLKWLGNPDGKGRYKVAYNGRL